jgi:hypothetical protein
LLDSRQLRNAFGEQYGVVFAGRIDQFHHQREMRRLFSDADYAHHINAMSLGHAIQLLQNIQRLRAGANIGVWLFLLGAHGSVH